MAESLLQDRIRSGSPFNKLLGEFLGKPFEEGAAGPDAYDCYGLCRAFMRRLGVELPDLGATSIEQAPNLHQQAAPQFIRLDWPRPWSLISLRRQGDLATHCGIVLPGDGLFLHAQERSGVVAEPMAHRYWHPRIEGYYWPQGIVEMVVMHAPVGLDHSWAFFREGLSIAQMLDVRQAEQVHLRVFVDGKEIERGAWESTCPSAVQQVVIRPQYGEGSDALRAVGMVVLMIISYGILSAPAAAGGLGLTGMSLNIAMAGVMVGGSYLMGALVPPAKPAKQEGSYGWNPRTIQQEGIPIPRIYGKLPVRGNIIMAYGDVVNTAGTYDTLSYTIYGPPSQPIIMPITVVNPATKASDYSWNVKLAYGDGPVRGIVAGSEKINGKPLSYYTGVTVEHRTGTDNQTATAMGDRTHYEPRLKCPYGEPQIYTFPDADVDKLVVLVGFPAGLIHYSSGGDPGHRKVGIKIEIREVGSGEPGWQTLVDTTENAKTTRWIHFAYASDGIYPGGSPVTIDRGTQYEVRLTKTSGDGGEKSRDEMYLEAVQGVYDDGFTYPGLVLSAVSAVASEKLSGSLEWEAIIEGRILPVYDGANWVLAYSNNPAWVIVDLLCRPVIQGDGSGVPYSVEYYRGIDISWIDAAAFKRLADWCAEPVDDGKGGLESRFTFNGTLETETEAWQAVLQVADMCRAWPYFNGRQVTVVIDKAATPVQAFTVGNIVRGSFDETWFDEDDRISEINYTILDENAGYRRTPIRIVDTKVTRRAPVSAEGWGITRQSQTYRTGIHKLTVNRLLPRSIEFPADLDAIYCRNGDVIYVQHDNMDVNQGGRATAVAGNTVTVDFVPEDPGGVINQILVRTTDATNGEKLQLYDVASIDGQEITISLPDWVYVPRANDVVMFGVSTQISDLYRIRHMRRDQDADVTIFATAYEENYYGPDALTPVIATQQAVSAAAADRALHQRPISWENLGDLVPQEQVAASTLDGRPRLASLAFTGEGAGTGIVTWTGSDIGNRGTLVYNGHVVWIQQDLVGTTDKYIYFDPAAADPTVLQHTNDRESLVGQEYYVVCVNDAGVAHPQPCVRLGQNATLIGVEEGADVTGTHSGDVNMDVVPDGAMFKKTMEETFENPFDDWETRWDPVTPWIVDELSVIAGGGDFGGQCVEIGDNAENDGGYFIFNRSIPFDPTAMYRMRIAVKRTAGVGTFSAGVVGRNATDTDWVDINGGNSVTAANQFKCVAASHAATANWTIYTGYFCGRAAAGTAGEAPDFNNPARLHNNVRYFRPFFYVNDGGNAGIYRVDSIVVEVIPQVLPGGVVTITGGQIQGITDLAVADGGTGASDAPTARTNLGLASMAVQAANNVAVTGGSISGVTTLEGPAVIKSVGNPANETTKLFTHSNHYSVLRSSNNTQNVALPLWFEQEYNDGTVKQRTVGGFNAGGDMLALYNLNVAGGLTLGTDLAVAEGGTGASDAKTAKVNLKVDQINVLDYGAVADGVTDNTTAFQNAINDAITNSRALIIPRSSVNGYKITGTLNIGLGLNVFYGLRIIGHGHPRLIWAGSGSKPMLSVKSISNSIIEGIWLDGNRVAGVTGIAHTTGTGRPSQWVTYRNIMVQNCTVDGIRLTQTTTETMDYVLLENGQIINNGVNLRIQGGPREITMVGGALLGSYDNDTPNNLTTYNLVFDNDGGQFKGYDCFFACPSIADIYLNADIAGLSLYGCANESRAILRTGPGLSGTHLIGPVVFDGYRAQQPFTRTKDATVIDYNLWQGLSIRNSWINGNVNIGTNVSQVITENNQFDWYNGSGYEYYGVTGNVGAVTLHAADSHRLGVGGIVDPNYPLEVLGTIYARSAATAADGTMLLSHGSGYSILKSVNKANATRRALWFQQQWEAGGPQTETVGGFDASGNMQVYHNLYVTGGQVLGSTLEITEDTGSTGNCQTNTALRIQDGGADTHLMIGVNAGANIGYLQTVQPGISWVTRHLALNPLGGNVGIGMENPVYPLEVNGTIYSRNAANANLGTMLLSHGSGYSLLKSVNKGGAGRIDLYFQQQYESGGTQIDNVAYFDNAGDFNVLHNLRLATALAPLYGGTGYNHVYVNRGDVAAADFAVGNFTCDGTWRDLNLSSIVGAAQVLVHLRVGISDADAYTYAYFRKKGFANAINIAQARVQNWAVGYLAQVWVETDANGVIQYLVNTTPDALGVTVLGWMK
jgi:hypothetical protein